MIEIESAIALALYQYLFDLNDKHYVLVDCNINLLFKSKNIFLINETNLGSSVVYKIRVLGHFDCWDILVSGY